MHSRRTTGSFATVLCPLAGIAMLPAVTLPAHGADLLFTEHVISTVANSGAISVFATDLNGDGNTDILSASFNDDTIRWYESDGGSPPTFTTHVITTNADGAVSVIATDVDGDGYIDVLSASFWDDKIAWYKNSGGLSPTFTEHVISTAADGVQSVFATDVDGDGDIDVLSASARGVDKIAWYESDGCSPPTFTEHLISTSVDEPGSVFATDVNGDGYTDVLSASFNDDTIRWYESNGASPPSFTEHVISSTADGAIAVFATDVNGDGDIDVLAAVFMDDTIVWYENGGGFSPTFTEHVISTDADGAFSVFATDVDGDGDTDILSAAQNDNKIAWYENSGGLSPTFTEHVISTSALWTLSVFATDVDGDGDTDVLSASLNDNKIAWYENTPDSDGDGVSDADDACPNSDLSETVEIGGVETGVDNDLLGDGCTIADLIDAILAADSSTVDVVQFLVDLKAEGIITGRDLGAILQALNSP